MKHVGLGPAALVLCAVVLLSADQVSSLVSNSPSMNGSFHFHTFLQLVTLSSLLFIRTAESFSWLIPPQPAGLSPLAIEELARKRYGVHGDSSPMEGRVVACTGAAGGIGRALTAVCHGLGATVVAMDRNTTGLDELKQSLEGGGNNDEQKAIPCSTSSARIITLPTRHEDLASVSQSAEEILSRFERIDLLINNAGMTYREEAELGSSAMISVHGYDLAFTVNYLSHVLLVEKLMPALSSSPESRIVHLTSTYHWKVDGTDLVPNPIPIAYESDKNLVSPKHKERSYGNTKLAQIWHSRSIKGCESVCACPTWVGTGIGGEEARDFLERLAFPVEGAGIASTLNAMFRSSVELSNALNDGDCLVANSRILEYLPFKKVWTSEWVTKMGWRDGIVDFGGLILLLGQRYTFEDFLIQRSSPESYGNREARDAFYKWSLKEVEPWL